MRDIDWRAVDMVCEGTRLALTTDEKRMVIRRLAPKMLSTGDWYWAKSTAAKLTAGQVAERLQTSERSVQRTLSELPDADKRVCPVCMEDMWVLDSGVVEPHADRLSEQCPMSGRPMLTGLAAIRPDLYQWLEVSA